MRRVNAEKLKEYLDQHGDKALEDLSKASGVSIFTLLKMKGGSYENEPSILTRRAICTATGHKEDDLFPILGSEKAV